jgi:hypothetical protein
MRHLKQEWYINENSRRDDFQKAQKIFGDRVKKTKVFDGGFREGRYQSPVETIEKATEQQVDEGPSPILP